MDCIILAGGLGTRLKTVVNNVPKPLAPINGLPFLNYLFDFLIKQNFTKVILSVYHKNELIKKHFNLKYKDLEILYSTDDEAYGTGGAIKAALTLTNSNNVFIINGDTFFDINMNQLYEEHKKYKNDITISLKRMKNFDRYGIVQINNKKEVLSLKEKEYCEEGLIDGGIYMIKNNIFENYQYLNSFSFNNFMKENMLKFKIGSILSSNVFIDIGTPEDFKRAQKLFGDNL